MLVSPLPFHPAAQATPGARAVHRARVLARHEVAPHHFLLQLEAPLLAQGARAGQFVHVLSQPQTDASQFETWNYDPFLRRALSLMSADPQAGTVELLFRVGGRGTTLLSSAHAGDSVNLIGPLGKPFDLAPFATAAGATATGATATGDNEPARASSGPMFHVKQGGAHAPRALVVGGGIGVPPLVFLGQTLREIGISVRALIGARTGAEVVGQTALEALGVEVSVATDDGSAGQHGLVTEMLKRELQSDRDAVVYACGPWPMLRAVAALCRAFDVACQVSLEEAMPCGIGVCNGCVVRARQPHASEPPPIAAQTTNQAVGDEWSPYHLYRRICVEGPACWAHEIDWDAAPSGGGAP